jgi:hypothetical protein
VTAKVEDLFHLLPRGALQASDDSHPSYRHGKRAKGHHGTAATSAPIAQETEEDLQRSASIFAHLPAAFDVHPPLARADRV